MESIEESSCALSVKEEPSIAQVSSFLQIASRQIVERTSVLVQAIVGDELTLEEEDTLSGILMRCNSLSLDNLTSLTKTFLLINPSDNSSASRAHEALETLLSDQQMGSTLGHWIEAVGVRAQYVKWLRSATESRELLMRRNVAAAEIAKLTSSIEAMEIEKKDLSATLKRLKAEIDEVEKEQKNIRSSLDEITVQKDLLK